MRRWAFDLFSGIALLVFVGCGGEPESQQTSTLVPASMCGTWRGLIAGFDFRFELSCSGASRADNLTAMCGGRLSITSATDMSLDTIISVEPGPVQCVPDLVNRFALIDQGTLNAAFYNAGADPDTATPIFSGTVVRE